MNSGEVKFGYALELRIMKTASNWRLLPDLESLSAVFGSLDDVFRLQGEHITGDRISDVIRVEHAGIRYYVKRYRLAGKGLRRFLGKPRVQSEWENLMWFARHGIPAAQVVAYGMERRCGLFRRGALITQEIPRTRDLADIARSNDPRLSDSRWVRHVSRQAANALRIMHAQHFIHGDFKWRNLLVDDQGKLFLIDCPLGAFWHGRLFEHRVLKDLASLDRVARYKLRCSQRLRFYLQYAQKERLDEDDKAFLRKYAQRRDRRVSSFAPDRARGD